MGLLALLAAGCSESSSEPGAATPKDPPSDASVDIADALSDAKALGHVFRKITLHRTFYCEGASYGDLNNDDKTDVVAGPHWYEGPDFSVSHELWAPPVPPPDVINYSDCFFQWVRDFDADGWADVLVVGFPGADASWYENPGDTAGGTWTRHVVVPVVDNESPDFVDLTGDGKPELLFSAGGKLGWAGPGADPRAPWIFHPLSDDRGFWRFTHGLGSGDVNGDGRVDVIEATGYWLQPASLTGDPLWTRHDQSFGPGGAQMPAYDVDGDGDSDVVTTLGAHTYGLAWYEQTAPHGFRQHIVVSPDEPGADAAVVMHEPHALAIADIDGDSLPDIVTGERFWGHAPPGGDFTAPGRLYWFRLERTASGASFSPVLIDDDSGVGTQVTVGDATDDGLVDIVVSNKKGAFVFVHEVVP